MTNELKNMKVGFTKNITGFAVTRWSQDRWEVGTWGRETTDLKSTIEKLNS